MVSTDEIPIWASVGSFEVPVNGRGSYRLKSFSQFAPLVGCEGLAWVLACWLAYWVTIKVWTKAWSNSHISLVVASTPATGGVASGAACGGGTGCGGGAFCGGTNGCGATGGGATGGDILVSDPVYNPSRGGFSSASPRPLSLIGGCPLPRFPLLCPLGGMILETKITLRKSKAHCYEHILCLT